MYYRIRKSKGSKCYWIQTALFRIGNWHFCRGRIGKIKAAPGGFITIPTMFKSWADAQNAIEELKRKDQEYQKSKTYKGHWQSA